MSNSSDKIGAIALQRQSQNNFLYPTQENRKFTRWEAWENLLLSAFYKSHEKFIQGKKVVIERGAFDTAAIQLAERWKWDRETVERFLKLLEQEGMITRIKVNAKNPKSATILKINKYNEFQPKIKKESATDATIDATMDATPKNNSNKGNKLFIKPTIEEIRNYCSERKNNIDAETFFYHYESNGWMVGKNKMKNWKASVITWEKKKKKEVNENEEYQLPG